MVMVADAIAVAVVGDDRCKCDVYIMFGGIPETEVFLLLPFIFQKNIFFLIFVCLHHAFQAICCH